MIKKATYILGDLFFPCCIAVFQAAGQGFSLTRSLYSRTYVRIFPY